MCQWACTNTNKYVMKRPSSEPIEFIANERNSEVLGFLARALAKD